MATLVGIVGTGNRVSFRPVKVVDSDRKKVRLSGGLSVGEKVVLNPGFGISDENWRSRSKQAGSEKKRNWKMRGYKPIKTGLHLAAPVWITHKLFGLNIRVFSFRHVGGVFKTT